MCFELFDFNLNSDLSQSELVMMMQSTVCGMICLTGGLEEMEPDLDEVERLAEEAFQIADTVSEQDHLPRLLQPTTNTPGGRAVVVGLLMWVGVGVGGWLMVDVMTGWLGQDKNRSINYKEFVSWARSNADIMSCMESVDKVNLQSANNDDSEDSAEEVGPSHTPHTTHTHTHP